MSDDDRPFSPSPSPVEEYEGDPDQTWAVSGVVGESVDSAFGVKRYEIKWGKGWTRQDGTNTTWESQPVEELQGLVETWNRKRRHGRVTAVLGQKNGPQIKIGFDDWQMLHEDRTVERARGYEELKAFHVRGNARQPVDFDAMVTRLNPLAPPGSERQTQARAKFASAVSSKVRSRRSRDSPVSSSVSPGPERRPFRPLPKRPAVRRVPPSSDSEEGQMPERPASEMHRSRFGPLKLKHRKALQTKWERSLHGAAPVVFVNTFNNEEIPHVVDHFQYLERCYVRAAGVMFTDPDCLVSCDCENYCLYADECGCQEPSELADKEGQRIFAYTRARLFNFKLSAGMEIIECNESCSCGDTCPNRVAQRPRDVPIEVFRTEDCGWGARATVSLLKGKIIGIYTGQLIRRETADQYIGRRKSYIFDLDVREDDEDEDNVERFSVDGYAHGNWTRFVNHSCEPNMRVVPVVWDTVPELNQPYLAFVATEDIPARTELTIDYDPKAAVEARKGKGKARQRMPEGARECLCGAESCRGWVRV